MMLEGALTEAHKANFQTMIRAVHDDNACLMTCQKRDTGEYVAVICMVNWQEDGDVVMVPVAQMFNDNPYDILVPPEECE